MHFATDKARDSEPVRNRSKFNLDYYGRVSVDVQASQASVGTLACFLEATTGKDFTKLKVIIHSHGLGAKW